MFIVAMKKTNTKLQLKTSTIRLLQNSELAGVAGGAPTQQAQNCSHPPNHPPGSGGGGNPGGGGGNPGGGGGNPGN